MDIIDLTCEGRVACIRAVPVREIVAPPGHLELRDPAGALALSMKMREENFVPRGSEPILLNVFPGRGGRGGRAEDPSWAVHCIDGAHRLVAGLDSGRWLTVGDIPADMLDVWVEGWGAGDTTGPRPRWIPLEIAEAAHIRDWSDVSGHELARGETAQIPGDMTNDSLRFASRHRGVRIQAVLRRMRDERVG